MDTFTIGFWSALISSLVASFVMRNVTVQQIRTVIRNSVERFRRIRKARAAGPVNPTPVVREYVTR